MHRLIMNPPPEMVVDHINHWGLDNRRENLRVCTETQNRQNRKISTFNKSGFKGVHRDGNTWRAELKVNGIRHRVRLKSAEAAAREYDRLARLYHGEFALTNFED